jgi:hypothetical protein
MRKYQRGYIDWPVAVIGTLIMAVILGAPMAIGYAIEAAACNKKASMMGLESDFGVMTGCMVKVGDRYAPLGFVRIVDNKVIIQGDGDN